MGWLDDGKGMDGQHRGWMDGVGDGCVRLGGIPTSEVAE